MQPPAMFEVNLKGLGLFLEELDREFWGCKGEFSAWVIHPTIGQGLRVVNVAILIVSYLTGHLKLRTLEMKWFTWEFLSYCSLTAVKNQ